MDLIISEEDKKEKPTTNSNTKSHKTSKKSTKATAATPQQQQKRPPLERNGSNSFQDTASTSVSTITENMNREEMLLMMMNQDQNLNHDGFIADDELPDLPDEGDRLFRPPAPSSRHRSRDHEQQQQNPMIGRKARRSAQSEDIMRSQDKDLVESPSFYINNNASRRSKPFSNGHHRKAPPSRGSSGGKTVSKLPSASSSLRWHEDQISRRRIIKQKINEYVNTFTVHGLTKVFVGERLESGFWLIILFCGLIFSVVIVYGLVVKFLNFGIYTEIRSQVTEENFFPSVTFCEKTMYLNHHTAYCGIPYHGFTTYSDFTSSTKERLDKPCDRSRNKTLLNVNVTSGDGFWSNGFFNITKCKTNKHSHCLSNGYFVSLESFNHSCVRWNYAGNLSGINNHVDIEFEFNKPDWFDKDQPELITATPHDSNVYELDRTQRIEIEPHKIYDINLDKTEIRRLPHPFPSNCSNVKDKFHLFPGHYTRRACIESYKYIGMYKSCGDTIDFVQPLIPQEMVQKYQKNNTINETIPCIISHMHGNEVRAEKCAFPCSEVELMFFPTFKRARPNVTSPTYKLTIKYHHVAAYRIMEEKALYSWDQLACEIGGFISVVIGASIISLIEVFVFLVLVVTKKVTSTCARFNKKS